MDHLKAGSRCLAIAFALLLALGWFVGLGGIASSQDSEEDCEEFCQRVDPRAHHVDVDPPWVFGQDAPWAWPREDPDWFRAFFFVSRGGQDCLCECEEGYYWPPFDPLNCGGLVQPGDPPQKIFPCASCQKTDCPDNATNIADCVSCPDERRLTRSCCCDEGYVAVDMEKGTYMPGLSAGRTCVKATSAQRAYVTGRVEDGHDHPLEKVLVQLFWDFNDGAGPIVIGSDWTDGEGRYTIEGDRVRVPMPDGTKGFLRVDLQDEDATIEIRDGSVHPDEVVYCEFGDVPRTTAAREWFEIRDDSDLERDLVFPVAPPLLVLPADMVYDPGHSDDCATSYYYTYLAVKFYRDFAGVTFGAGGQCDHTPLPIITWSVNNGVYCAWTLINHADGTVGWDDPLINIDGNVDAPGLPPNSAWNSPDAPKNREFHEFSHYVMQDVYDGMQSSLTEYNDVNLNGTLDRDVNHGGYRVNHVSTTDAWEEGFAEFMGCVIADWAAGQGYSYRGDHLPSHYYTVGTSYFLLEDRNPDYRVEEVCVASMLWDLYDGINAARHDTVELSFHELWSLIIGQYDLPEYWALDPARRLVRDWRGDELARGPGWYETERRHIGYVKDSYDALQLRFPQQAAAIDDIFIWRDVYVDGELFIDRDGDELFDDSGDIWLEDFDLDGNGRYTAPGEVPTEVVELPPATGITVVHEDFEQWEQVPSYVHPVGEDQQTAIEVSRLAAQEGEWGLHIAVETDDTAVVGIDKPLDGTGTNFVAFWAKVPGDVEFELQLADDDGLWVSPTFQGKDVWGLYYASYAEFSRHPIESTGESGSVNRADILGSAFSFATPGSYTVYVDYITSETAVSEEQYVEITEGEPLTIVGVGSPGRAYRRKAPPVQGSLLKVAAAHPPAVLQVDLDFDPPYDDLGFSYSLDITEEYQEINLYPPTSGTMTLTQMVDGQPEGDALTITTEEFWEGITDREYIRESAFELGGGGKPLSLALIAGIAASVLVVIIAGTVLLTRRR
jgi:hypothetical protein